MSVAPSQPRIVRNPVMSRSFVPISLVFVIAVAWLGTACERLDASHCWNRQGDATCAAREDGHDYCSPCASAFDGCVEAPVDPGQCPAVGATTAVGTETTGSGASTDETTSVTGGTTTLDLDSSTSAQDGTDTAAPPPAMECGNGIREGNEVCDGSDFGGVSCADFGGNGALSCNPDCTLNPSQCGGPDTCGNGVVEPPEQCDGDELDGMTCADVARSFPDGELSCSDCSFNTTQCCIPNLMACSGNDQCCSGTCLVVCMGG